MQGNGWSVQGLELNTAWQALSVVETVGLVDTESKSGPTQLVNQSHLYYSPTPTLQTDQDWDF